MALGMNFSSGGDGGDIVPYVKYDSRAGRISRADRTQGSDGSYGNEVVDITSSFKAVIDLENIEIGYFLFAAGAAPQFAPGPAGRPDAAQARRSQGGSRAPRHDEAAPVLRRRRARNVGNAASFLRGFDDLHTAL
jgi:hypothetical protein